MAAPADRAGCPLHLLPDPWKAGFLAECTDGKTRLALAQTCKGCWQWLVRDTAEFRCTLSMDRTRDSDLFYSIQAAGRALQLRTKGPNTSLLLRQTKEDQRLLLTALAGLSSDVPTLGLDVPNVTRPLLRAAASAFPKLHTLQLGSDSRDPPCRAAVPYPEDMPSLQHLVVGPVADTRATAMQQGVSRLLPQLTSLRLTGKISTWASIHSLRRALSTPSTSLRQLYLPVWLDYQTIQLVTQNAPHLRHLGITTLAPELSRPPLAPVGPCSWTVLELLATTQLRHAAEVEVSGDQLPNLPSTTSGGLEIKFNSSGRLNMSMIISQGTAQQVAEQLQRFTFTNLATVHLQRNPEPSTPAAAAAILQAVAPLRAPDRTLHLTLTAAMSDAHVAALLTIAEQWPQLSLATRAHLGWQLTSPLPPLHTLNLSGGEALTIGSIHVLSRSLSSVRRLCAADVYLSSNGLHSTPSPWQQLELGSVSLDEAAKLPSMTAGGARVQLRVRGGLYVILSHGQAGKDTRFNTHQPVLHFLSQSYVRICAPENMKDQAAVAAALRHVLRQLAQAQGEPGTVTMHGFKLSAAVLRELPNLPRCHGKLEFEQCIWEADKAAAYSTLSQLIPNCYKEWYLTDAPEAVVRAVCAAAPADRTKANPLHIVHTVDWRVGSELQRTLDSSGMHPYVHVPSMQEYESGYWEYVMDDPEVVDSDGE